MYKLLKVLFVILLLLSISEFGYYLYINSIRVNSTQTTAQSITPEPKARDDSFLFNQGFLDYIATIKKVEGKKILWQEQLEGYISDISFSETKVGTHTFKGYFVMSNSKGEQIQRFGVTENRLKGWKFFEENSSGGQKLTSFYNLKVGDKIKYITNVDVAQHNAIQDSDIIDDHFVVSKP